MHWRFDGTQMVLTRILRGQHMPEYHRLVSFTERKACGHFSSCWFSLASDPAQNYITQVSASNGRVNEVYPSHKRREHQCESLLCTLLFLGGNTVLTVLIFAFQETLPKDSWTYVWIPELMIAMLVEVSMYYYKKLAIFLTEKENHRTFDDHTSALFTKLFVCLFYIDFAALFYIAFFKQSLHGCSGPDGSCSSELTTTVFLIVITNDVSHYPFIFIK